MNMTNAGIYNQNTFFSPVSLSQILTTSARLTLYYQQRKT